MDAERVSEYFTITGNAKEKWEKVWRWGGDLDIKFEVSEGQVGEDARLRCPLNASRAQKFQDKDLGEDTELEVFEVMGITIGNDESTQGQCAE